MTEPIIVPYRPSYRSAALDLAIRAWEPVFVRMRESVPAFVYDNFSPDGWQERQLADLAQVLDEGPDRVDVAQVGGTPAGWVCTRLHADDSMGEISVIAVAPEHQRQGIGRALMDHAHDRVRRAGMRMVMVAAASASGCTARRRSHRSARR